MKIGIWTDSHYSTAEITCWNRYNSASLKKIYHALLHFHQQHCDLAICLGDLIDKENDHEQEKANLLQIVQVFDSFSFPILCLMGNHDAFTFTTDEFYAILGENRKPHFWQKDGKNLLFLDACHFQSGVHYAPGDSDWTDTFYPDTAELKKQLLLLQGDTYVFMHQNIDKGISTDHRLSNDAELRKILDQSGIVRAEYQGHYHPGFSSENAGIQYITFPAMCENDDAFFILDL